MVFSPKVSVASLGVWMLVPNCAVPSRRQRNMPPEAVNTLITFCGPIEGDFFRDFSGAL
jgi:hypothetical protein